MDTKGKSLPDEVNTFSFVIRAIQSYAGTDSETILRMAGSEMGHAVSKMLVSSDLDNLLDEIAKLSKRLDIGEMTITRSNPLQLTFHRCLGCTQIPGGEERVYCPLREEFLKAVMDDKLNVKSSVKFLESVGSEWGMKDCTFQVDLTEALPVRRER